MEGNVNSSVWRQAPVGTADPYLTWSRRRFVAQGLLSMAAVAPVLARAASAPVIGQPPPDTGATGAARGPAKGTGSGSVRTASENDNRLTTTVYINGSGPYRFLVDTGAERTLIAAEIATSLGLPLGRKVMVEGITRREPASLAKIANLRMGSLLCPALEVPMLPRAMLNVDGYLGLDVLDQHRVLLDFRAGTLTVTRPPGFFSALFERADEAVVSTLGSSGRLRATDCRVNGVRAAAFVDTGAEVSVANPALYTALLQHARDRQIVSGPVGLLGVTGGMVTGLGINVSEILLGGELRLTYTTLVVASLEVFDIWGLSKQPALLLGMDALRRFARVSIDYRRKQLRFQLASATAPGVLEAGLPPPLAG